MRKDIHIPEVKDVYLAVVREKHLEYQTLDWNAYIINNSDRALDTVLIVSRGFSPDKTTPVFRHQIPTLPARSFAKIEYLQEPLLALTNEFKVSFFAEHKMFEKTYRFQKNSINKGALQHIPLMNLKGVLRK
jgi:hypothetical protein